MKKILTMKSEDTQVEKMDVTAVRREKTSRPIALLLALILVFASLATMLTACGG